MTRTLILIAAASFVLAVVCLGSAAALGGYAFWAHPWNHHWAMRWDDGHRFRWTPGDDGAVVSRQIAWTGGDSLDIDLPADVQFTQAPGAGSLTVTGPRGAVDDVELANGHLDFSGDGFHWGRVKVVMTAPAVSRFSISGEGNLAISGYDQDQLEVDVSGSGDVAAKGRAKSARIEISGDGAVDLGSLAADSADADISGDGRATIAPTSAADLRISGDGEIHLLTHPASVNTDISGDGRIVQAAQPAANAAVRSRSG